MANTLAKAINGEGNVAASVTFASREEEGEEETIPAGVVMLSTGAEIQTEIMPSRLLNTDGSVRVDCFLRTGDADIYAAGDIASFPNLITMSSHRIEHWTVA